MNDPYSILGVSSAATDEEISRAYRKLARQYHPDLNPGNAYAESRMKEINSAYEAIKDIRSGKKAYAGERPEAVIPIRLRRTVMPTAADTTNMILMTFSAEKAKNGLSAYLIFSVHL